MPEAYAAHEALVAPARPRAQIWRLLAGLATCGAAYLALGFAFQNVLALVVPQLLRGGPQSLVAGNTPLALLVLLFSFGLLIAAVAIAARLIHHRGLQSITGPRGLVWHQFRRVGLPLVLLHAVLFALPPHGFGGELVANLPLATWAMLLPLSLLAILVQVSAEEILFRGYLQQTLAARFRSPVVWMLVPAVLFGAGHFLPAEAGGNAGLIAAWAVCFGLLMADLTARAGSLGPAIAVHMVNNVIAVLVISVPDSLSGLALATTAESISDTGVMRAWILVDFAFMMVNWLVARIAIRR